jgi:hypothetical protein
VRRFVLGCTLLALFVAAIGAADKTGTKDSKKAAETRKLLKQKVTVSYDNTPISEVKEDLKAQISGLGILLDTKGGVSNNLKFTYKAENKPLAEVLDEMFKMRSMGYIVQSKPGAYDGTILFKRGKERGYAEGEEPEAMAGKDKDDDEGAGKDKKGKTKDKAEAKDKKTDKADKAETKDSTETDEEKAERDAARKLKFAKTLEEEGKLDRAKTRYEEIVTKYPKTKAAEEAKELLKKLEQKESP